MGGPEGDPRAGNFTGGLSLSGGVVPAARGKGTLKNSAAPSPLEGAHGPWKPEKQGPRGY